MLDDFLEIERRDGVAVLWLDEQGRAVNTLSPNALKALEEAIDELENDPDVVAGVIISRKPNSFVAGADLDVLKDAGSPEEASALSRKGHEMIRRVRGQKKPIVAAIHGPALGGGLELALTCTYRVASGDPPTRFALPEVMLGLLPGGGGTQLLPRLVGLQHALPMMLTGKNIFPHQARKMGLVDLVTHRHNLLHAAVSAARDLASGKLEVDHSKTMADRVIEATPVGRKVVYKKAAKQIKKETGGNYPAPPLILECVRTGLEQGIEAGFEAEAEHFGRLVFTPEHRALVGIFRAKQRGDKNPFDGGRDVQTIGILGGGLMGSGIAEVSAVKGLEVRIKDANLDAAAGSRRAIWKSLQKKVKRRQISGFEADTFIERVQPVESYHGLSHAEIVIEAVPEDLSLKRRVLAEVEAVTGEDAIFATNTSSIPISEIAAGAKRPERVVGMHYFSPVPQRPLLEVIRKDDTPEDVLATVCALGLRQGKTIVVVRDGPGFYTTRILAIYLNEAALALEEGCDAEAVDRAMRAWGFPMGPFELMDLVGLDVGAKVTPVLTERMQDRDLPTSDLAARLLEGGLLGQKSGRGFYLYDEKKGRLKARGFNPEVYEFSGGQERTKIDRRYVQERLGLLMVNEAVRCLEEGILDEASDGDLAAVFGLGFPPFRGGPFRLVDQEGPTSVVARLERLAEKHGSRFAPSELLAAHAREGKVFYE
jgi:3-hydroxyacyl-CoA dehydrogenase / enoyl-CoA hydratase / 3-hydroxybutyryl-CoA epimerase